MMESNGSYQEIHRNSEWTHRGKCKIENTEKERNGMDTEKEEWNGYKERGME